MATAVSPLAASRPSARPHPGSRSTAHRPPARRSRFACVPDRRAASGGCSRSALPRGRPHLPSSTSQIIGPAAEGIPRQTSVHPGNDALCRPRVLFPGWPERRPKDGPHECVTFANLDAPREEDDARRSPSRGRLSTRVRRRGSARTQRPQRGAPCRMLRRLAGGTRCREAGLARRTADSTPARVNDQSAHFTRRVFSVLAVERRRRKWPVASARRQGRAACPI